MTARVSAAGDLLSLRSGPRRRAQKQRLSLRFREMEEIALQVRKMRRAFEDMKTGRGHENVMAAERRIAQVAPLRRGRAQIGAPLSGLALEIRIGLLGESLVGANPAFDSGDPFLSVGVRRKLQARVLFCGVARDGRGGGQGECRNREGKVTSAARRASCRSWSLPAELGSWRSSTSRSVTAKRFAKCAWSIDLQ